MPEKALKDYTNAYIREELAGKTPQEQIEWLEALQAREEREMKKYGSAIEWERQGLGLSHMVTNPLETVAAIKRAMKKAEAAKKPTGSVIVFPKEDRPKGGRRTRVRRHRRRHTARKH